MLPMPPELAGGTSRKVIDADRVQPVVTGRITAKRHEAVSVGVSLATTVVIHMGGLMFKYAALERNDYGVSTVARFKFGQNALYVSFDGMHRELEVIGDDLVGLSLRNRFQNV